MSRQGLKRLEELFEKVCDLSPEERDAVLDAECNEEPELRRPLERLLTIDRKEPFGSRTGILRISDAPGAREDSGSVVGGRYRLLRVLGEGGMGIVYLAEQTKPVRRQVALKLIKLGMDSKQVLARFEVEQQVLAIMDHVGLAKVFDAGITESRRPYFVMEYVDGIPITEYCDEHQLPTEARLRLFMLVCDAITHAHQHGIIHRDIKPSNVLVTGSSEQPVPKVIDFGVAKATGRDLTDRTLVTEQGQLIGTPEYMSPEQILLGGESIDTRTDVYALGVILYELLVGSVPFPSKRLREAGYAEIHRIIREEEPRKPSTELIARGEDTTRVARNRRTEARRLVRDVRGDLDWITMKALERDRTRRYGSASGLVADIQRHLNHEPVLAGPPSPAYRLRKFLRRYRASVTAGALVFTSLVVGLTWALVQKQITDDALVRVLRLSDSSLVEAYTLEGAALWPAHPEMTGAMKEWLAKARELYDHLAEHRDALRELRGEALPHSPEEMEDARRNHPEAPELEKARGRLVFLKRALAFREEGTPAPPPRIEWDFRQKTAAELNRIAWPLVNPARRSFGQEDVGLALARRAVEVAAPLERASFLDTLAWAYFACGLDEEAAKTGREALAQAPAAEEKKFEIYLRRLLARIADDSGEGARRRMREEVSKLVEGIARLEGVISDALPHRFADNETQWRHDRLAELVQKLERFGDTDPRVGILADVGERLAFAEKIEERSISGPEAAAAWERAQAEIDLSPLYGPEAKSMRPQMGLFPLGADPDSGLQEFLHLQIHRGEIPAREEGKLVVTEEMGLVFVLIPGGTFRMGAERPRFGASLEEMEKGLRVERSVEGTLAAELGLARGDIVVAVAGRETGNIEALEDALASLSAGDRVTANVVRGERRLSLAATVKRALGAPNVDPQAEDREVPVHGVSLSPFFLSKYEVTQGQWLRITGHNPSLYGPAALFGDKVHNLVHPVEQVTWVECRKVVRELGLVLPTEAQWEYAARGGTSTVWWTGDEKESLVGAANLSDRFGRRNKGSPNWVTEEWLDDGYTVHAPVGSYRANAFGLHDVVGNVWEWCRDSFGFYRDRVAPGDGERQVSDPRTRVTRGGSYGHTAAQARPANRNRKDPDYRSITLGVRPARAITQPLR